MTADQRIAGHAVDQMDREFGLSFPSNFNMGGNQSDRGDDNQSYPQHGD